MKRQARIFISAAALALALLIAANAYVSASAGNYTVDGEVVYGQRADAAGVELGLRVVEREHVVIDAEYSAGSGDTRAGGSWSLPAIRYGSDTEEVAFAECGIERSTGRSRSSGPGTDDPYVLAVWEAIKDEAGDAAEYDAVLELSAVTDTLPLALAFGTGDDAVTIYGLLDIPLYDWLSVYVRLRPGRITISRRYPTILPDADVCSVRAGDWLYFFPMIRNSTDGALLDGSLLPGGDWGLLRIRYPAGGKPDAASLESVCVTGPDLNDVRLFLSGDGRRVLLVTAGSGGHVLTAIDAAGGEVIQSTELVSRDAFKEGMAAADYRGCSRIEFCDGEGWAVFRNLDLVVPLTFDGTEYTVYPAVDAGPTTPGAAIAAIEGAYYYYSRGSAAAAAFDGERLAVAQSISIRTPYDPDDPSDQTVHGDCILLSVFENGALAYSEWLDAPLTDQYSMYNPQLRLTLSIDG